MTKTVNLSPAMEKREKKEKNPQKVKNQQKAKKEKKEKKVKKENASQLSVKKATKIVNQKPATNPKKTTPAITDSKKYIRHLWTKK